MASMLKQASLLAALAVSLGALAAAQKPPASNRVEGRGVALGVGANVVALSKDGKLLWERSVGEEFAAFTTHGGRTMSPLVDGELVIVSAAISSWGTQSNRAHRFIALDKRTGAIVWVANPGGRPYDTAYALPLIATINGTRLPSTIGDEKPN